MKNLLSLLLIFLLFQCGNNQDLQHPTYPSLIIKNINTIDPVDGLKENQTLIISGDRIIKIEDANEKEFAKKDIVIDGSGKYLIPGLWDAHVHFAYIEELAPSMFNLFLAYGITGVRDTGGKIDFVKKWKAKSIEKPGYAPTVMIAGPLLDGMPNVYDGSVPTRPPLSVGLGSVDVVKQMIDILAPDVDLLKAYEMLTPEQFITVMKKAKEKGLKVTGHVPLSMDVISASNAGLNSMEHLRNLEMSCASNADELLENRRKMLASGVDDEGGVLRTRIHQAQRTEAIANQDEEKTKEVLAALAKNQTWQIPTLTLMSNLSRRHYLQPEWQKSFNYLPDSIAQSWRTRSKALSEGEIPIASEKFASWGLQMTGKVHQSDIGIMAGTDCPIFYLTPGMSLHFELAQLVEAGLTPLEAIKTATLRPAEYFGLKRMGRIQTAMIPDLVVLDANPLEDIKNTQKIHAVVKNGKVHLRSDLDRMLIEARQSGK